MKQWLLVCITVLGLASLGSAQKFTVGGALNLSAGSGTNPNIEATVLVGANDIARLLIVGVDARLEGNFSVNGAGVGFSAGAAALATLNVGIVTVYGGPQVVYVIAPTVSDPFRVGGIVGARYNLILGLSAFGEVGFLLTNPFSWRVRVGASLSL